MGKRDLSRRDFLRLLRWGALGVAANGGVGSFLAGCSTNNSAGQPRTQTIAHDPDLALRINVEPGEVQILPGRTTSIWRYQGKVVSGDAKALQPLPESYLGPVVHVSQGQLVRVRLENRVDQPTIVHWHGLLVPPDMDGHPTLRGIWSFLPGYGSEWKQAFSRQS